MKTGGREEELFGETISSFLARLVFGGGGTSPLKARGWMGGLLGYSQPWKPLVWSCDANCLQPDTFLDVDAGWEASIVHLEASPGLTSACPKHVPWAPTSAHPRHAPPAPTPAPSKHGPQEKSAALICPGYLSWAVCGTELVACGLLGEGQLLPGVVSRDPSYGAACGGAQDPPVPVLGLK